MSNETASLRFELAASQAHARALELQLAGLHTTRHSDKRKTSSVAEILANHAASNEKIHTGPATNGKSALKVNTANTGASTTPPTPTAASPATTSSSTSPFPDHTNEDRATLLSTLLSREQAYTQLLSKYDNQSHELSSAHSTITRLQTSINLINKQLTYGEDYKTLLKWVVCKLYAVQYRQYQMKKQVHKSCSELMKAVAMHEAMVGKQAVAPQSTATKNPSDNSSTTLITINIASSPSSRGQDSDMASVVNSLANTPRHALLTITEPPTPTATQLTLPIGIGRRSMSSSLPRLIASTASNDAANSTGTNDTHDWMQRDRTLWNQSKSLFIAASHARRERSEKLEYKLQYSQAPTMINGISNKQELRRIREKEKRARATEEPATREHTSAATTKLFQAKNTALLLECEQSKIEHHEKEVMIQELKEMLKKKEDELKEAMQNVCACTMIEKFSGQAPTKRHYQQQQQQVKNGKYANGGGAVEPICVCDCIEVCECVRRRSSQQQMHHNESDEKQDTSSTALTTLPPPHHSHSHSRHSNHSASSSSLHHHPSSSYIGSLATLTAQFGTSLGSGRNGRTHAVLNEGNYVSAHVEKHRQNENGLLEASASTKTLPSASTHHHRPASPASAASIPFLQRTIKSLRSRLLGARNTILHLQDEIVTSGYRKQMEEEKTASSNTASHHPSSTPTFITNPHDDNTAALRRSSSTRNAAASSTALIPFSPSTTSLSLHRSSSTCLLEDDHGVPLSSSTRPNLVNGVEMDLQRTLQLSKEAKSIGEMSFDDTGRKLKRSTLPTQAEKHQQPTVLPASHRSPQSTLQYGRYGNTPRIHLLRTLDAKSTIPRPAKSTPPLVSASRCSPTLDPLPPPKL